MLYYSMIIYIYIYIYTERDIDMDIWIYIYIYIYNVYISSLQVLEAGRELLEEALGHAGDETLVLGIRIQYTII